jgi:hypothetical protein
MKELGKSSLYGIAQQHNQASLGATTLNALRHQGMKEVIGSDFAALLIGCCSSELPPIPTFTAPITMRKKMQLLLLREHQLGMGRQQGVQRDGASLLNSAPSRSLSHPALIVTKQQLLTNQSPAVASCCDAEPRSVSSSITPLGVTG